MKDHLVYISKAGRDINDLQMAPFILEILKTIELMEKDR
jgi:hypothetical protein